MLKHVQLCRQLGILKEFFLQGDLHKSQVLPQFNAEVPNPTVYVVQNNLEDHSLKQDYSQKHKHGALRRFYDLF